MNVHRSPNYFSFTTFSYKIGLVRTLVADRVYKIKNSWLGFHNDIKNLTIILCKNPFPVHIFIETIISQYLSRAQVRSSDSSWLQQPVSTYYFKLPYVGSYTTDNYCTRKCLGPLHTRRKGLTRHFEI